VSVSARPYVRPCKDPLSRPFWDGLTAHQLCLQSCAACDTVRHPPAKHCPACLSEEYNWTTASGNGVVYSFAVIHNMILPQWQGSGPLIIAQVRPVEVPAASVLVRFNEATNLIYGDLVNCDPSSVVVGLEVHGVFDDVDDGLTLLRWEPAPAASVRDRSESAR